jgi:uncharacterized membrane protein
MASQMTLAHGVPIARAAHRHDTTRLVVAMALSMLVAATCAAVFLPHQSLWVDETTQMSGLRLGPIQVVRWLTGADEHDFGVPNDRMPPLSYWAGWAWSQVFGLNETAMRWMGVIMATLAAGIMAAGGYRLSGRYGAWTAGLLFALSPNIISAAVEIRAYPLLLLLSVAAMYMLIAFAQSDTDARRNWLIGLVLVNLLAMYCHFFGVVLAGSVLFAAAVISRHDRRNLWRIFMAAGIAGVMFLGLIPFVISSVDASGQTIEGGLRLRDLAKLVYRLVAHPAVGVNYAALAANLAGGALAALAALIVAWRRRGPRMALLLALVAGMTVTVIAGLAIHTFDALKTSYSLWMVPAVYLLIAAGLGAARLQTRRIAGFGVILLLAAHLYGALNMTLRSDYFTHGPHDVITATIGSHTGGVAVIYEPGSEWGHAYFPLRYTYHGTLRQYRIDPETGSMVRLPREPIDMTPVQIEAKRVLVINTASRGWQELRRAIDGQDILPTAGPISEAFEYSPDWRLVDTLGKVSFVAGRVMVYERIGSTVPPLLGLQNDAQPRHNGTGNLPVQVN